MKIFIFFVACNVIGFIGCLHNYIRYKKDCNITWKYKPLLKKELIKELNYSESVFILMQLMYCCMGLLDIKINGFEFNFKAYRSLIVLAAFVNGAITICVSKYSQRLTNELNKESRCNLR